MGALSSLPYAGEKHREARVFTGSSESRSKFYGLCHRRADCNVHSLVQRPASALNMFNPIHLLFPLGKRIFPI